MHGDLFNEIDTIYTLLEQFDILHKMSCMATLEVGAALFNCYHKYYLPLGQRKGK